MCVQDADVKLHKVSEHRLLQEGLGSSPDTRATCPLCRGKGGRDDLSPAWIHWSLCSGLPQRDILGPKGGHLVKEHGA